MLVSDDGAPDGRARQRRDPGNGERDAGARANLGHRGAVRHENGGEADAGARGGAEQGREDDDGCVAAARDPER